MSYIKMINIKYLDNKLKCASDISVAANNNNNVNIADSHVKERAASDLAHRTRP